MKNLQTNIHGPGSGDSWSISGNVIYRHHVEPRVKLCVLKEESYPVPLKYIDVTRTTDTSLEFMLEKNIDDYWNVDGERELSETWTGLTFLNERPQDGCSWSGERLTRKQTTSRADTLWPEIWKDICPMHRNAQREAKAGDRETKARRCQKIAWYSLH